MKTTSNQNCLVWVTFGAFIVCNIFIKWDNTKESLFFKGFIKCWAISFHEQFSHDQISTEIW